MKRTLLVLIVMFCALVSRAQMLGNKIYLFPDKLLLLDTTLWKTNSYEVFLNALNGFADLKSKTDKEMRLSIQHNNSVYNFEDYKRCRCYPDGFETYPRYQHVQSERKVILEKDTFHISVHDGSKGARYHISWCRRQTFSCYLKVSTIGPAKDSTLILENLVKLRQGIQEVTPAEMDALFALPISDAAYQQKSAKQLALYDKLFANDYGRKRQLTTPADRQELIKTIRDNHRRNYAPVGWTTLPDLASLSLDSLVRIYIRYSLVVYIGGNDGVALVPGFFPQQFTFQLYEKSIRRLVSDDLTLADLVRYYSNERLKPGEPFYYSNIAQSMAYLQINTDKIVKPFFSKDFHSATHHNDINEEEVQFNVMYKIGKEYPEGHLLVRKEGSGYKTQVIPPLFVDKSLGYLQDMHRPGKYFVRELVDWGDDFSGEKRRIYLVNTRTDSTIWISFNLPLLRAANKNIAFQFSDGYEDTPVINMPKWSKLYPGERPVDYYKAHNVADNGSSPLDQAKVARDKLLDNSPPTERSYTYSYLLADVNKDGKKDIVSFIVSNGNLVFYKCFTQTLAGLKELSGENIKAQLKTLPKYKELLARSLLKVDKAD